MDTIHPNPRSPIIPEQSWVSRFKVSCYNDPLQATYTIAFATSVIIPLLNLVTSVATLYSDKKRG